MKYLMILILIGLVAITSVNGVYGFWIPETPDELFKQSETVFVGNIASVNNLEFERSNTYNVEENGVSRIIIENYTQTLDEYTVDIEEFLKNPQTSHTITMLEATVGKGRGLSVSIGGFELGDRVLFFVPKIDGTNQYSPESFRIPKQCDAQSVLEQPRITLFNDFKILQDGIEKNDNFTANKPIEFVYNKDMDTLKGKNFDVDIKISKITDNEWETILEENIHTESKQCEWISTATWEFVPTAGRYYMWMHASEGNSTGGATASRGFNVLEDTSYSTGSVFPHHGYHALKIISPLKQFKSGIAIDEIQCRDGFVKVIKKSNNSPACVKPETKSKLVQRDWIEFQFSFCGADGFDFKGNLNKNNSTHHWDENECNWIPIYQPEDISFDDFDETFGGLGNRHPAFLGYHIPDVCTDDMIKFLKKHSDMFDNSVPYSSPLDGEVLSPDVNPDDMIQCENELLENRDEEPSWNEK